MKKKYGISYITQPPETQHNGPWIRPLEEPTEELTQEREIEVMDVLIDQLEALPISYYRQNFSPTVKNWLPFYWRGYSQTTRYTFQLDCSDYDDVLKNVSTTFRNVLKKSKSLGKVYESYDYKQLHYLCSKTFERQKLAMTESVDYLARLVFACREHGAGKIYFAKDEMGNLCSGSFIIYDKNTVYLIKAGTDPEFKKYNFQGLLIMEAIKFASETGRNFDFEGSMLPGINEFFRKFNGKLIPYSAVSKVMSKKYVVHQAIKYVESLT